MLQRLKHRAHNEEGFTLVELLVVILIIGILAAIALPTFLGQSAKAQDSSAKSGARNAVSVMDSCGADKGTYTDCTLTNSGLTGVELTTAGSANGYAVTATSESGNRFIATKTGNGSVARTCNLGSGGTRDAGCRFASTTATTGAW